MDRKNLWLFIGGGLLVAVGLAFFLSPKASSSPDGLEKVAIDEGFIGTAEDHSLAEAPLADYSTDGIEDESVSRGVSGIIGVAITFGIGMIVFGVLRLVRSRRGPGAPATAAGP